MDTPAKKVVLEIPRRLVDKRFDVAALALIQKNYGEIQLSRGALARLIKVGSITLNGLQVRANHLVHLHDTIELVEQSLTLRFAGSPSDIHIPILYEDASSSSWISQRAYRPTPAAYGQ
jgi:23S rRNA-/tRNA-specific pseudouridylate synthase